MNKIIEFKDNSRTRLLKGIETLTNAVITTLGPSGRNVIISSNGEIQSTKDGVTVAKSITLEDAIENLGAELVKQASIKTAETAGDGTTTSTLLAHSMIKQGIENLNSTVNVTEVKKGIEDTVEEVIDFLNSYAIDIKNQDQIEQVATISANDSKMGKMIAQALKNVGRDGVVTVDDTPSAEDELEMVEGMQFERGYKSPYFVNNNEAMACNMKNPKILLFDGSLDGSVKEVLPLLEHCSQEKQPLVIIAENIDGEVLSTMLVNKMRGTLSSCAVKAPDYGEKRLMILEDIAALTGATVVSKAKGMRLTSKEASSWLGTARNVNVTKNDTTIIGGEGDLKDIEARIQNIKEQIDLSESSYAREHLQQRLARLTGGVAIIKVGGYTETEIKEKRDRIDDALQATQAAIEEGIIPGSGIALLKASKSIGSQPNPNPEASASYKLGRKIVFDSIALPFEVINRNAGVDERNILENMNRIVNDDLKSFNGFNLFTNEFIDLIEAGIIDPVKVTKNALRNAASVAATVLLTEAVIVDKPSEDGNVDPTAQFMQNYGM